MPAVADQQFTIPAAVQEKYPELVSMLQASESIDAEEKQYWFTALETMEDAQVESLRGILMDEKEQLEQIDQEYEQKAEEAFDEAEVKVKEQEYLEELEKRRAAEHADRQEDADRQEELLAMLDNL